MMIKENLLSLMKDKLIDLHTYSYNKKLVAQKETVLKDSLDENID
jgi:hypothetical protein